MSFLRRTKPSASVPIPPGYFRVVQEKRPGEWLIELVCKLCWLKWDTLSTWAAERNASHPFVRICPRCNQELTYAPENRPKAG